MQIELYEYKSNFKIDDLMGRCGALLLSQHMRGRGRKISDFKSNLIYKASSRIARTVTDKNPVSNHKN